MKPIFKMDMNLTFESYSKMTKYLPIIYWKNVINASVYMITLMSFLKSYNTMIGAICTNIVLILIALISIKVYFKKIIHGYYKRVMVLNQNDTHFVLHFYSDYLEMKSDHSAYTIDYKSIPRIIEDETHFYLLFNNIIFSKENCNSTFLEFIRNINPKVYRNVQKETKSSKKFLIKNSQIKKIVSYFEYLLVGILLGFVIFEVGKIEHSYTTKNMSSSYLTESDCEKIEEYENIIGLDFPSDFTLIHEKWKQKNLKNYTSTIITFSSGKDIERFTESIRHNSNWIQNSKVNSSLQKLLTERIMGGTEPNNYYYSFYIKEKKIYNVVPEDIQKYHIYAMMYDVKQRELIIEEYMLIK